MSFTRMLIKMNKAAGTVCFFGLIACGTPAPVDNQAPRDPYVHLTDAKVASVLKQAIDWSGGIEAWRGLDSIKYHKHSKLFLEDSTLENEMKQSHAYAMKPNFSARISWDKGSDRHLITYGLGQAQKQVNGRETDSGKKVEESVFSALYVLGMPFKLLDAGVNLTYQGMEEVRGVQAHVIKATYDPQENDNHSTTDVWWYYFNEATGEFLGCMVHHPPTYAYIENQAFHTIGGIKMHAHRRSYRSDSARNIAFLRAEFWYDNYELASGAASE